MGLLLSNFAEYPFLKYPLEILQWAYLYLWSSDSFLGVMSWGPHSRGEGILSYWWRSSSVFVSESCPRGGE